jgi:hypothetical protein
MREIVWAENSVDLGRTRTISSGMIRYHFISLRNPKAINCGTRRLSMDHLAIFYCIDEAAWKFSVRWTHSDLSSATSCPCRSDIIASR